MLHIRSMYEYFGHQNGHMRFLAENQYLEKSLTTISYVKSTLLAIFRSSDFAEIEAKMSSIAEE